MVSLGGAFAGMFKFNSAVGLIGTVFLIFLLSIILFGGFAGIVIWYVYKITWTEKAEIYRMVGGKLTRIRIDKGKFKKVGRVGDTLFFIGGKTKRHLGNPQISIAPHTWMFFERKDKELINFGMGDIDTIMQRAGIFYVHDEVRMQRLGIEKNLKDAFKKEKFWDKYGATIMNAIYVVLVTISLVVLFSKLVDVAGALKETAGAIKEMAQAVAGKSAGTRPDEVTGGTTRLVEAIGLFLITKWKIRKCQSITQ